MNTGWQTQARSSQPRRDGGSSTLFVYAAINGSRRAKTADGLSNESNPLRRLYVSY